MADPGQRFRETDTAPRALHTRRLITAAVSDDYCLLHYESGGIGHWYAVLLFQRSGDKSELIWASAVPGRLDLQALKVVLESGRLENQLESSVAW